MQSHPPRGQKKNKKKQRNIKHKIKNSNPATNRVGQHNHIRHQIKNHTKQTTNNKRIITRYKSDTNTERDKHATTIHTLQTTLITSQTKNTKPHRLTELHPPTTTT